VILSRETNALLIIGDEKGSGEKGSSMELINSYEKLLGDCPAKHNSRLDRLLTCRSIWTGKHDEEGPGVGRARGQA